MKRYYKNEMMNKLSAVDLMAACELTGAQIEINSQGEVSGFLVDQDRIDDLRDLMM